MRVTIIGAGIHGLSAAWALTRLGHRVTLLEQADAIPNPLSASGDAHRMIRRAYGSTSGASDGYGALIPEAFAAWDSMWADLGATHYAPVGILCVSQAPGDEADEFRQGFDRAGIVYERLEPGPAADAYPYLDPATFHYAFVTPEGGALLCRRIAADLLGWLLRHGVEVRTATRATELDADRGTVTTEHGDVIDADRVVVTAGAWVLRLCPDLAGALQSYRTAVVYLEPPQDLVAAWRSSPAVLSIGGDVEGYVLPPVAGTGLKFGAAFIKRPTGDPDADRTAEPGEGERLRNAFAPPLARIHAYRVSEVVTCAYTFTHDKSFFGTQRGRTLIVSACSGHAYKFGAAIGLRIAATLESGDAEGFERWLRAQTSVERTAA